MKEKLKRWLLTACAAAGMALACHSARGEKQFVEELVGGAVKNTV